MHNEAFYITESKRKCRESGMDPNVIASPKTFLSESDLDEKQRSYQEILAVVSFFSNKLLNSLKGTPILVVTSDADGFLLHIEGDSTIKSIIEEFGIRIGGQFSQEDTGTNVISLALQQKHPISLIGSDHYHTFLQGIACYGTAFHYTDEQHLLGSVCIMMPIEFQNPLYLAMLSQAVDSIERELLLRKQNRKLNVMNQIMLSRTSNGIVITDEKGITVEFNDIAEKISENSRASVIGRNIFDSPLTGQYFRQVIENETIFNNEFLRFTNKSGQNVVCLFDAQPVYEDDRMVGAFGQFRDITDQFLLQERYNYLANHDELTSLPNRRYFKKVLYTNVEEYRKGRKQKMAILSLDLDRFKMINDNFGHSNGDSFLKDVSRKLSGILDETDFLARMGGDEFILLMRDFEDERDVEEKARKVLNLFKHPFQVGENEIQTTASIGIAVYPDYLITPEQLMIYADNAMYQAKSNGKNCYVTYTNELHIQMVDDLQMEWDLKKALERNEFALHYQPQIDNRTGRMVGLEALIRWQHPEFGLLYPDKFIKLAEDSGLITKIGEWVINEACAQNKRWQDSGMDPVKISVNLSTQQFLTQDLVHVVEDVLQRTGLDPQYLVVEITEYMAMEYDYSRKVLEELKALGIGISIDDFGTGYSSLKYLKEFPIDYIKIDKSFVSQLFEGSSDAIIIKAIITLAHNLHLNVIAEGVETKAQLDFMKQYQCDITQGYYYSKPVTAGEIEHQYLINRI